MVDPKRERALEEALLQLYVAWSELPIAPGKARRYYAARFRQMIVPGCVKYKGGVQAVKHVLYKQTTGFARLTAHPELTVASLVLSGKWDDLFDDEDRAIAGSKLACQLR